METSRKCQNINDTICNLDFVCDVGQPKKGLKESVLPLPQQNADQKFYGRNSLMVLACFVWMNLYKKNYRTRILVPG
jgi:hypothetical protein